MVIKRNVPAIALCLAALAGPQAYAQNLNEREGIRRVLLISIDGMHAVDYQNCVADSTNTHCPNLAALGKTGVNYTRTSTSKPSDSFPGLMALVTGGSPRLVGAFYDVAYDRRLALPVTTTGNGVFGGHCHAGVPNGTTTEYEEGVEINQALLNGGDGLGLTDGGIAAIDPHKLPRDPFAPYSDPAFENCAPVWPWNFIRANTIYGVIHAAGGYTAWSDKHAVYAAVSGPTGTSHPSNVDDYYSPEVNSNVLGLPGVMTPSTAASPGGINCNVNGNPPDNNNATWTDSFVNIQCYDTLKVQAVLNWIAGKNHNGGPAPHVPNIFGMNFQAASVGQKLIEKINGVKVKGGYLDAGGTPSPALLENIEFVDASIGEMVKALNDRDLLDSTLIIVTAKHGQSPIDPNRFKELGNGISTTPADVVASYLPPPPAPENPLTDPNLNPIGPTQDDISLLWLNHGSDTASAVQLLETNADAAGIGQIFYNGSLETMFNPPGLGQPFDSGDPRTPDIIVQPYTGVIYTGSSKKQEEHGGFAQDDTNVMMLVSNPNLQARTVTSFVETLQVAPTVLSVLGLNPGSLDAVKKEGTPVLPGLNFHQD